MRIIRAGEHIQHIPGYGISVRESGVAVAAANWWEVPGKTCVAAYQPKGAASYAASKVNLANPGIYDATDGAQYPTWDTASGWILVPNQYLETAILPTATTSALVQFSDTVVNVRAALLGSYSGNDTTRFYLFASGGIDARAYEHAGTTGMVPGSYRGGNMAIAGQVGFYNGSPDLGIPGSWSGSATVTLHIGHQNGFITYCVAKIQAVAIYSDTLTDLQIATVAAAMAAL